MAAARLPGWLARCAEQHGAVECVSSPELVSLRYADGTAVDVAVPFPPLPDIVGAAYRGLLEHVARDRRIALLLVRRGGYGVGVVADGRLVESKVGSRHVQGKTKAGGWSQRRFANRRDGQARVAFAAAADVAARVLPPQLASLDALVCGGDRRAVEAVLTDVRLRALAALPRGRFLDVPDPRKAVLAQAAERATAVAVTVTDPAQADSRGS